MPRLKPLTEITTFRPKHSASRSSIRNASFAEAFKTANRDRLWTDEIRARDNGRNGIVAVAGLALLVLGWFISGRGR